MSIFYLPPNAIPHRPATLPGSDTGAGSLLDALQLEERGMALDFRTMTAVVRDLDTPANNFVGNANDFLTYASPSTKLVRNSSGVYESGITLRTDHLGDGTALGLLCEPSATNLVLNSSDATAATWTKIALTVTANATTAPDGTVTASKLVPTAISDLHRCDATFSKAGAATQYTYSGRFKAGEWSHVHVWCDSGISANSIRVSFDLSAGTVSSSVSAGSFTLQSAIMRAEVHGFWSCEITFTTGPETTLRVIQMPSNSSATPVVLGDGTSGIYHWHTQMETGPLATSPIVTGGATGTRVADSVSLATSAIPFNPERGTIIAAGAFRGGTATGLNSRALIQFGDGGSPANRFLFYNTINGLTGLGASAGVVQFSLSGSALGDAEFGKGALGYELNNVAFSREGAAAVPDASANMPIGIDVVFIGIIGSSSAPLNGWVRDLVYLPRRVSNAELQTLSAL